MFTRFVFLAAALLASTSPAQARTLTLAEAVDTAIQHQPQLVQARASTEAALARADEARAPILPQLTGTASYVIKTGNVACNPGAFAGSCASLPPPNLDLNHTFAMGLNLTQFIWDFGQTTDKWKAAKATAHSTQASEKTSRATVLLNVRTAFFTARAQHDLVTVARDTLANYERHLTQIEGMVRVGTHPEIDLAQAKTDRANAQAALIGAENAYETAKAQLMVAMGLDAQSDFEVSSDELPAVDGEEGTTDSLLGEAVKARPELVAFEDQLRAQKLTLSAVKGGYGPSLSASMNLTEVGTSNGLAPNWNVGLFITWPLFSGLLTYSQVHEQHANLVSLEAQRDALRQQVRLDVEQARLAVRAAKATLTATAEALVNAKERLRLAEGRYTAGVGNAIELGDAQVALTNAAAQRTQAEFNVAVARAQLLRALGRV